MLCTFPYSAWPLGWPSLPASLNSYKKKRGPSSDLRTGGALIFVGDALRFGEMTFGLGATIGEISKTGDFTCFMNSPCVFEDDSTCSSRCDGGKVGGRRCFDGLPASLAARPYVSIVESYTGESKSDGAGANFFLGITGVS